MKAKIESPLDPKSFDSPHAKPTKVEHLSLDSQGDQGLRERFDPLKNDLTQSNEQEIIQIKTILDQSSQPH